MFEGNKKYTNGEITVFWYPKKCIHATTCYRELIEVFNPRKRPWINMAGAPTSEIIRVVKLCPTQALTYEYNDPSTEEKQHMPSAVKEESSPAKAILLKEGPLVLKGNFIMYDAEGKELVHPTTVSICTCGASKNHPFCDGTHNTIQKRNP